jgi:hypothetical protein
VRAPWIAPDEILYALLGRSFWETGHMHALAAAPFYGFYPVFAGLPLAALGPATGLTALQVAQALVVSSTAVVVYCWALELVSAWWAIAATAMTAALPALAYSGLIMTESVFLPAATLALWLLARALVAPTWRNQAYAAAAVTLTIGIRLQSLAFFPAVVVAIVLFAWFERDRTRIGRLLPFAAMSAAGLILLEVTRRLVEPSGSVAYASTTAGAFRLAGLLLWSSRMAGDLFLLVLGVPLLAVFALAVGRVRSREPDPVLSALVAVAIGYTVVTIVEVGGFVSVYSERLQERYVIATAPALFVTAVVWLARGMRRPQPVTAVVTFIVCIPALLLPVRHLATRGAIPDSFMLVSLVDLGRWTSAADVATTWAVGVAVTALLFILLPRRLAPLLAAIVIAGLVAASVLGQRSIDRAASFNRSEFFGTTPPQWIVDPAGRPIAYLDNGDPYWNGVLEQAYWNPAISTLALLVNQTQLSEGVAVSPNPDGRLIGPDGRPLSERLVAAPSSLTLVGRRIGHLGQGPDEPGITLWQTADTPTLASWTTGLLPSGDFAGTVKVTVFHCRPGSLELTLFGEGRPAFLSVSAGQLQTVRTLIPAGVGQHLWVATPPGADGRATCTFYVSPEGPLGSNGIAFQAGPKTIPAGIAIHRLGASVTELAVDEHVDLSQIPAASTYSIQVGYCLGDQFVQLDYNQPALDPRYKGAVYANFVAGKGLTCAPPPPGYRRRGLAPLGLGVPAGIYPYYAP